MSRRRAQRGMTLPLLALSIFAIMAVAALAVDAGVLYTSRTSAQHAADAAALAGAFTFMDPIASQPAAAQQAAISTAAKNNVLGNAVSITAADVLVDTTNRRVTVTVPLTGAKAIPTFFAQVAGFSSIPVQTKATAEASTVGTAARCLKPIFLPNTIMADPSLTVAQACGQGGGGGGGEDGGGGGGGNPQVIFNPKGSFSPWFQAQMPNIFGTQMNIRPTSPGSALLPSQFYSLDFGSGASTYRCTIGQCLNDCPVSTDIVKCGDQFPVETGNMVGPTNQGVDDLIGNPADAWYSGNPTSNGFAYVSGSTGQLMYDSRAVAVAPIWNNCTNLGGQDISSGTHGQKAEVVGFATIFIEGMSGTNLKARLIGATRCAAAGGSPGSTGPLAIPIRLVQNQ